MGDGSKKDGSAGSHATMQLCTATKTHSSLQMESTFTLLSTAEQQIKSLQQRHPVPTIHRDATLIKHAAVRQSLLKSKSKPGTKAQKAAVSQGMYVRLATPGDWFGEKARRKESQEAQSCFVTRIDSQH